MHTSVLQYTPAMRAYRVQLLQMDDLRRELGHLRSDSRSHVVEQRRDANANVLRVNQTFLDLMGLREHQAVGRKCDDLFKPPSAAQVTQALEQVLAGEERVECEVEMCRGDGSTAPCILTAVPFRGADGELVGAVACFKDATRLRRLEDAPPEAQDEHLTKEKLAVLGRLAGNVGHELRNPLGVMKNSIYFLKMVLSDAPEKAREHLGILDDQIDTADEIITDLLDFSRVKPPMREDASVELLIEKAAAQAPVPPNVRLQVDVPPDVGEAAVDPAQMHHVLLNILRNAVQAMPSGGDVSVTAQRSDKTVTVSVADTGSGIAAEHLGKIFEPLFTTKAKGTGLGLSVCRNLAEANDGEILVESEVGRGTTIHLRLPASVR